MNGMLLLYVEWFRSEPNVKRSKCIKHRAINRGEGSKCIKHREINRAEGSEGDLVHDALAYGMPLVQSEMNTSIDLILLMYK